MTPSQYNKLNELLSQYSTLSAALEAAEAEIKTIQLAAAQPLLPRHAQAKVNLANIEIAIREMSDTYYAELFGDDDRKTHKTPFGDISYRKSNSLKIKDDDLTIAKVQLACATEQRRFESNGIQPRFAEEQLLRTAKSLNLEALEKLDDATLGMLGIQRQTEDKFSVKPFAMKSDKPAGKKAN